MTTAQITKDTKLREVLERWPETAEVLARFFGEGCFTCPGAMIETIEFAATMHSLPVEKLLEELNAAIKQPGQSE
ncbi:MAG: DUF1858 domain-containing protein [Armatimonadetes bacterium]|nr:DUF1858 domain-containing protein [Armatimonadota bacterium]NIM23963.1 DUF1858 domain-containing protein [Armatimonadota bacterium]NIM67810.1 DUF1858 domain-containing protein [Armatimonadota bacterium]NIM76350.1 DUF1858 domain-containing protein [Armatimonadota bacterium]NIN06044.1 DUF1858 domain-containing protein [Armatimonadota bacterium]